MSKVLCLESNSRFTYEEFKDKEIKSVTDAMQDVHCNSTVGYLLDNNILTLDTIKIEKEV